MKYSKAEPKQSNYLPHTSNTEQSDCRRGLLLLSYETKVN